MNPTVFVSYPPDIQPLAEQLVHTLEEHGVSCWAAFKDLHPGQNVKAELDHAASNAEWFAIVARPRNSPTPQQQYEWRLALTTTWDDSKKSILPVVVGDGSIGALREWAPLEIADSSSSPAWTYDALRAIQSGGRRSTDVLDSDTLRQRAQRLETMKQQQQSALDVAAVRG